MEIPNPNMRCVCSRKVFGILSPMTRSIKNALTEENRSSFGHSKFSQTLINYEFLGANFITIKLLFAEVCSVLDYAASICNALTIYNQEMLAQLKMSLPLLPS